MEPTLGDLLQERPSGRLYAVSPGAALAPVLAAMQREGLGCLLVVQQGRLKGLLEAPDTHSPIPWPAVPSSWTVARRMHADPPAALPSMSLGAALRLCAHHQLKHLPVTRQGRLLGLLDWPSLALAAAEALRPEQQAWMSLVYGPRHLTLLQP